MSAGTVLLIAVPVLVLLAAVAFVTTARRRDTHLADLSRETRRADRSATDVIEGDDVEAEAKERYTQAPAPAAPAAPALDAEALGLTRRQLLNRGIAATSAVGGGGLAVAFLAFCYPSEATGFGAKITAGTVPEITDFIKANRKPFYVPDAKTYLTAYPKEDIEAAKKAYDDDRLYPGFEAGLVALFQTCPHLGCTVPWCSSSQWFECPCHGSKYNRVGEKRGGPAPRGMDRFPIVIEGGKVAIDTGNRITGPAIGTNSTGQEPEGPHCV